MSDTINQDGTPVLIESLVYRYSALKLEEHDTIEEAQGFCEIGEDWGALSTVGIYVDGEPHSIQPWDWHSPRTEAQALDMRRLYTNAKSLQRPATQRKGK